MRIVWAMYAAALQVDDGGDGSVYDLVRDDGSRGAGVDKPRFKNISPLVAMAHAKDERECVVYWYPFSNLYTRLSSSPLLSSRPRRASGAGGVGAREHCRWQAAADAVWRRGLGR